MQESCPFWPAHIMLSVMGNDKGLDKCAKRHLSLLQVSNVISCNVSGAGPSELNLPHPTTVAVVPGGTLAPFGAKQTGRIVFV